MKAPAAPGGTPTLDDESILRILGKHPEGMTTDQVQVQLLAKGVRVGVDKVAGRLRGLVTLDKVQFVPSGRLWKACQPSRPGRVPVSPRPPEAPRPNPKTRPATLADDETKAFGIPVRITRSGRISRPGAVPVVAATTDWGRFRALLPYYQRCLAAEERAELITHWDRRDEQFLVLAPQERWWPHANEDLVLSVDMERLPPRFVEALSRRAGEPLYLGYPIQYVLPKGAQRSEAFLYPVAALPMDWRIKQRVLELRPAAELPHVNSTWTKYCRDSGRDMDRLLEWLGVVSGKDNAEEATEVSTLDFTEFADALQLHFAAAVATTLTPASPDVLLESSGSTGMRNALGLFVGQASRYSKGTARDLRQLEGWSDAQLQGTALAALVTGHPQHPPDDGVPVIEPFALGEDQLNAVREGLTAPLTVITGPPGTGKSQVVAAVMACAAFAGRSALLASRNHKALDAVQERLEALAERKEILMRVSRPWGEGAGVSLTKALGALLQRPGQPGGRQRLAQAWQQTAALDRQRQEAMEQVAFLSDLADDFAEHEQARLQLETRLGDAATRWLDIGPSLTPWPGPPRWLRRVEGLSWVPGLLRRVLARRQLRQAPAIPWIILGWPEPSPATLPQCRERHSWALEYLQVLAKLAKAQAALKGAPDRVAVAERVVALSERLLADGRLLVKKLLAAMEDVSDENRKALTNLRGELAIRAGSSDGNPGWSAFARGLLGYFPLWATTNLSAAGKLPLEPGLFDYVIIDEASQSDIASALPLLARARRAIVVGDPAQLRHVSSLSPAWERDTLTSLRLPHEAPGIGRFLHSISSLYDLAASSPGVSRHLLRDHFRCHEAIAQYVSETFYGGQLHVLTPSTGINPPPGTRPGLHWTEVEGPIQPAKSGCHSPAEAEQVVNHARELLVDRHYEGSIGIVTPFREQARRITDLISDRIPADVVAHAGLRAFTAHRFQGDARDVILVSLCLGPDMPPGSLAYLRETGNLFNVAVSRARAVCHLFGNRQFAIGCGISHVTRLVQAVERRQARPTDESVFESPWEKVLYDALVARGIQPIPQYPLAGRRLDLAVTIGDWKLDIEVDGDAFHRDRDGMRRSSDIWRDHQIRGLGWQVIRFWVYQLKEDLDGCVERIHALIPAAQ